MTMIINDPEVSQKIANKIIANRKKRDEQMTEEQRTLRFLSEKATDFLNIIRERAPKNKDGLISCAFAIPLDEPVKNQNGVKCRMLMMNVYECDDNPFNSPDLEKLEKFTQKAEYINCKETTVTEFYGKIN